jgi:hypothetical protein
VEAGDESVAQLESSGTHLDEQQQALENELEAELIERKPEDE